jgi:Protein of unknown function (DUF2846)
MNNILSIKKMCVTIGLCCLMLVANAQDNNTNNPIEIKPKDSTNTIIIIYRGGQFNGALSNYAIYCDDKKLCKLSNAKYMYVEVPKGKHIIAANIGGIELFKKVTTIEIETEPGGMYFVSCAIKQSIMRTRLELTEVTKNSAKRDLEKCTVDICQDRINKGGVLGDLE